jgi:predicted RNA polymerase sigma factor
MSPGLAALDALPQELLSELHRPAEARAAYTRAIGLSDDPAIRAFLTERASRVCAIDPPPSRYLGEHERGASADA